MIWDVKVISYHLIEIKRIFSNESNKNFLYIVIDNNETYLYIFGSALWITDLDMNLNGIMYFFTALLYKFFQ